MSETHLDIPAAALCPKCQGPGRDWLLLDASHAISIAVILDAVALETGIRVRDIKGPARFAQVVRARHLAAWLAYKLSGKSLQVIGRAMGGRDHTTTLYAVNRMRGLLPDDGGLRALAQRCERRAGDMAFSLPRQEDSNDHNL